MILLFLIFLTFLISSAGSLLASKNIYCEKNTAIIRCPPRRVTALQVLRTPFLGPRPRLEEQIEDITWPPRDKKFLFEC